MDNFDQLDVLVHDNQNIIQYVIMFVISATLLFVIFTLLYSIVVLQYKNEQIPEYYFTDS
ncbi:Maph48 [Matsumuraeses phaseoli granulovirus]|uniref:Maph48 n=1 Tax=Matsumuraeses phaseoli granulovirus TaxID=2760664 RepID=A0AAE7MLD4_9BBAC|nr:Maph48 [Matsumuraeses phaseoli granulovirus]QOD40011.1 Maph48 [Matsumuraeses phaseoli granulovirus]